MELRFQGGHSIPVHSLKLKLASSVLKDMITAVLDDQIASAAAKRRKTAEYGGRAAGQDMPQVQVSQKNGIVLRAEGMRDQPDLCGACAVCIGCVLLLLHHQRINPTDRSRACPGAQEGTCKGEEHPGACM